MDEKLTVEQPVYSTQLQSYVVQAQQEQGEISAARKELLVQISELVAQELQKNLDQHLVFICTHNSRRSHFAHVWCQIAMSHFNIANVSTWSGGTEITHCNPRTVAALRRAGLAIDEQADSAIETENPIYKIRYTAARNSIECSSKIYNQPPNPADSFIALLCCSDVDKRCPVIEGAAHRFSLHYKDPKCSDDTDQEQVVYDERCLQIASEMFLLGHYLAEQCD